MKRRIQWIGTATLVVAVCLSAALPVNVRNVPADAQATKCVLIDAGHGGADGGAVAHDGTLEKDINLAVALPLRDMLRVMGFTVQMTRESDVSIHDPDVTTIRDQKVSDMRNRLQLYQQAAVAVGIHQNHFPVEKYHGTQVFYGTKNEQSRELAETIRQTVVSALQPENTRELKSGGDVFLLKNATCPAVFVECGFLSNRDEAAQLNQTDYQRKMALSIAVSIMKYIQ